MFRMIPDLIATITGSLPPWAVAVLALIAAWWLVPGWFHGVRVKQIKAQLRKAARAGSELEREEHLSRALELGGADARKLVALCDESHKLNQKVVFQTALQRLRDNDGHERDIKRLVELSSRERPVYRHPVEAAVAIERLIEGEMWDEARARLDETLSAFPGDPDLVALVERLPSA